MLKDSFLSLDLDRISAGLFRRLQRPVDRYFQARHPGPAARALIGAAAPLVRRMIPNDKWSLGVHAPHWMRAATEAARGPLPPPRRIFQFCAYRGQFTLELTLASLLAWRGHQVTIGYLPRLGSPLKPPFVDHSSAASYLAAALSKVEAASHGRVRIVDLSRYADAQASVDPQFIENQAQADAMMRTGREIFANSDPDVAQALDYYRALGHRTQRIAQGFFAEHGGNFDIAAIANGMSFEAAHFAHGAAARGLGVVTFEKFAFRRVRITTHGDTVFTFRDLAALWRRRKELGFEREPFRAEAVARAQALLDERRRASVRNWAWKYQFAPDQSAEASLAAAGVKPGEPYILVCTNVPFDAGFMQLTNLFPSMREWLVETVRFLLQETGLTVVVRVHPGEKLHHGGRERSSENLAAAGLSPHPRLRVVEPDAMVNTYPLMENSRAGAVFSSTVGVEMAMLGRPVVVGSDVYYANRGFTRGGVDRQAYFAALRDAVAREVDSAESRAIARDAQLFYYLLHFVLQQPYPYDKGDDVRRLPPGRLVGSPDIDAYLPFLDGLATTPAEFEAALADGSSRFSIAA